VNYKYLRLARITITTFAVFNTFGVIWSSAKAPSVAPFVVERTELERLHDMADEKLQHMLKTNSFVDHNIDSCDYHCRRLRHEVTAYWVGENLYRNKGECDLVNAFKLWEKSPTHKANLDHSKTNEIMLTAKNADYCYIVHEFIEER
jgi:hypothetical protein